MSELSNDSKATGISQDAVNLIFSPAVGTNADGRLEVFVWGSNGGLWDIWQTAPNNGWSGWASLGSFGPNAVSPTVGQNADGRLEVFVTLGELWHIWQTAPNNGWSGLATLGQPTSAPITRAPAVGRNTDGRLEVFVLGGFDGNLWRIYQCEGCTNGWSGWASLGQPPFGPITDAPVVSQNTDGRLEVFVRGNDGGLWHIWQTRPGGNWSGWASLGRLLGDRAIQGPPAVGRNTDGRLEVFALGDNLELGRIYQCEGCTNGWSGWASLGGVITGTPTVGQNADGRLEVFARGDNDALWHIWQTRPGGDWSGWASLGGPLQFGPAVGTNADGRLEVFVTGVAFVAHNWQTVPNGGWSGWSVFGNPQ